MGRMEVITRTERRRSYDDDERAAAVAASFEPGVTVREVARRLGIAESLLYNWRSAHRKATSLAEPMQFISYSAIPGPMAETPPSSSAPLPQASAPVAAERITHVNDEPLRPTPSARPGSTDITLPSGVQLSVDSFVNEKALARVLRALEHGA